MTEPNKFQITYIRRIVWWKRPWHWIRLKPTKFVTVYQDAEITSMSVRDDGEGIILDVDMVVPRQITTVHVSSELKIP